MSGQAAVQGRSAGPLEKHELAVLSFMRDPESWQQMPVSREGMLFDWVAKAAKVYWEGGRNPWCIERTVPHLVPIFEGWLRDHIAVCKTMVQTARDEGHSEAAAQSEREAAIAKALLDQRPPNSSWSDEMECMVRAPEIRILANELVHILKLTGTKNPNDPEVEAFVRSEVPERMARSGQVRPAVIEDVLARVRAKMRAAQKRQRRRSR